MIQFEKPVKESGYTHMLNPQDATGWRGDGTTRMGSGKDRQLKEVGMMMKKKKK